MPVMRRRIRETSGNSGTATRPRIFTPTCAANQPQARTRPRKQSSGTEETPWQTLTIDLGVAKPARLPTRVEFDKVQEEYVQSLSIRKREKALLTQEMFDDIWDVLQDRMLSKTRTPQFRFWVRKMFTLSVQPLGLPGHAENGQDLKPVILHEGRPVAVKSQIYDIIGHCHQLCQHGGRDRTMTQVKVLYSWVPKELVSKYVKLCPTCNAKKSGSLLRTIAPTRSGAPTPPAVSVVATPTQEEISASRILPPPTPHLGSILVSSDPHRWLSHLVSEPGPNIPAVNVHLAPLIRWPESENDGASLQKSGTRMNLPPLMKALSENALDFSAPMQHVPFNVSDFLQVPLRSQMVVERPMDLDIDPSLCDPSPRGFDMLALYEKRSNVIATPVELPRKVLIPNGISLDNIHRRLSASLPPALSMSSISSSTSMSSVASSSRSVHDIITTIPISTSGSEHLGDISSHTGSSSGRKSDCSFASEQNWESSYCLDSSF
ncbi:hypothetical protein BDY19DRAFT_972263 [Irpex rosettiformis]|uniref:Uncharacterized protein n=1 Tax=Irpex rosettiformis TaxID=378272 RepID=A0ACB8TQI7_9APHY|nr:hypothetical protein BDY19DRAFT_972263 [Irpex rosettiformis]